MDAQLFVKQDWVLHSGTHSNWKIDCDALSDNAIETVAFMLQEILPPFGRVYGIPRGGIRLADAMRPYLTKGPLLVVDDVLTTGAVMHGYMKDDDFGAVIFARGLCPPKITPLFQKTLTHAQRYSVLRRGTYICVS